MFQVVAIAGIVVLIALLALGYYLLRPLAATNRCPRVFHCYDIATRART